MTMGTRITTRGQLLGEQADAATMRATPPTHARTRGSTSTNHGQR